MLLLLIALLALAAYQAYETAQLKKELAELQQEPVRAVGRSQARAIPPPALDPLTDPLETMREMQREMDEILHNQMGSLTHEINKSRGGIAAQINAGSPEIKLNESSDAYEARISFDDITNVEVKVSVDASNVLHIKVSQKQEQSSKPGSGMSFSSTVMSNFERAVTLAGPVQAENLRTTKDGNTLVVVIPKA